MTITTKQREALMRLCREVNRVDDGIGARSDHEGQEDGPTYQVFTEVESERYEDISEAMIEFHRDGMRVWRELRKLRRTVNTNPENR